MIYKVTQESNNVLAQAVASMGLRLLAVRVAPNLSAEACAGARTIYVIPESLGLFGRKKNEFWKDLVSSLVRQSGGELFNKWGRLNPRSKSNTSKRNIALQKEYEQLADVDFGYACTAHKSQGSQWENVFVLFERSFQTMMTNPAERRRWTYTACTRAARNLSFGFL